MIDYLTKWQNTLTKFFNILKISPESLKMVTMFLCILCLLDAVVNTFSRKLTFIFFYKMKSVFYNAF